MPDKPRFPRDWDRAGPNSPALNEHVRGSGSSTLAAVLANHVPVDDVGKIVLLGTEIDSTVHALAARRIRLERLIFICPDRNACNRLEDEFAGSIAIQGDPSRPEQSLAELIAEPAAAVVTTTLFSKETRDRFLEAAPTFLVTGGRLVLLEDSQEPIVPLQFSLEREASKTLSVYTLESISGKVKRGYIPRVASYLLLVHSPQKLEKRQDEGVKSPKQPQQDEGRIESADASDRFIDAGLPPKPKRQWTYDFRGKLKRGSNKKERVLIAFLEDVYGAYLPKHRDLMRAYIRDRDPALNMALKGYGFANLPEHLQMPSSRERVALRLKQAATGEYGKMSRSEQRSVRGKSLREQQKHRLKP